MSDKLAFFISHCSCNKELARYIYHNAIKNNIFSWYDEALLHLSMVLRDKIEEGIQNSNGFLLLYSVMAANSDWVKTEMEIAKAKQVKDPSFKLIVVKLDDTQIDSYWTQFLYQNWDHHNEQSSVIGLMEALTEKKGLVELTTSALLTDIPSDYGLNKSGTIAEHTRNFVIYNLAHIKGLLTSVAKVGYDSEMKDTITKLLGVHLFNTIPALSGGFIRIGNGELEFIHANRMRIAPKVSFYGVTKDYIVTTSHNDEVVTRVRVIRADNGDQVNHAIPMGIVLDLEAEL
jgi:hypothetical protein